MNRTLFCYRFLFSLFFFAAACYRVPDRIDPRVSYPIQDQHFSQLTSAFSPLSPEERNSEWGREVAIAHAFAEDFDLYRAISTYKRAEILLPPEHKMRKLEMQYDILLCYFLGKRYNEAIDAFDKTDLAFVDKTFAAYHDLLLTLYECYRETEDFQKEERILELMEKSYPETAEKLRLSSALREGDLAQLQTFADGFYQHPSYLNPLLNTYSEEKKSPLKAQLFNALVPGAGYLYIGQKKSALTALLLNGLFIAAATQFFLRGHLAAGIIMTGFEAGWYFGGIYGAGEEAKYYNERLYEKRAATVLNEHMLFPTLMMQYSF